MRSFQNIAKLIRQKRQNHPQGYSQSELSQKLGYKNGQFISNVERGLCNIPLKMLAKVSEVLDVTHADLKEAILADHCETLDNYLTQASAANVSQITDAADKIKPANGVEVEADYTTNTNVNYSNKASNL